MFPKSLYKGKKNLFVIEVFDEHDDVYFTAFEINIKLRQFVEKRYVKDTKKDYLKAKGLRPISFQEFDDELVKIYKDTSNKFNNLNEKFLNNSDEMKNSEFRHFVYEFNLAKSPMLTEGILKALAYAKMALEMADNWNLFVEKYNEKFDATKKELTVVIPEKLAKFREMLDSKCTTAVVKKGKFMFDDDVLDDLPLDDEEENKVEAKE